MNRSAALWMQPNWVTFATSVTNYFRGFYQQTARREKVSPLNDSYFSLPIRKHWSVRPSDTAASCDKHAIRRFLALGWPSKESEMTLRMALKENLKRHYGDSIGNEDKKLSCKDSLKSQLSELAG
ncbi:MAG: hypothetical protein AB8B95_08560 [Pseudohongiellaceae bacterium]